jgi:hypothetical protein
MLRDEIARGHATREAVDVVRKSTTSAGPRHELLERFLRFAMKLDPAGLRETLSDAVDALGPEHAIRDVALPAMREMGSRWKAGVCDTAHEHLATEAVRVWLARQSVMAPAPFRPYPLVLACGPKDLHTIGLEAFGVILARRGWSLRTLGSLAGRLPRRRDRRRRGATGRAYVPRGHGLRTAGRSEGRARHLARRRHPARRHGGRAGLAAPLTLTSGHASP